MSKDRYITKENHSEIFDWLCENINVKHFSVDDWDEFSEEYSKWFLYNDKEEIDVLGVNIQVINHVDELKYPFGEVEGDFIFEEDNYNLDTLKNCPKKVGNMFECLNAESLTSLKGCPTEVHGSFNISCYNLESLEFSPIYIGWDVNISFNGDSLIGLPDDINEGSLNMYNCWNLKSFIGCPDYLYKDLRVDDCETLISLKGFPLYVSGDIIFNSEYFSNDPSDKKEYKLYIAMWLELFESIDNEKRKKYITNYKDKKDYYKHPIIPIEIMKEYGF